MEEGWWGSAVAQARARGWRTGDGGSTEICGGEVVAAGVPANDTSRDHVSGVPQSKGSSRSLTWQGLVGCGVLTRRVDLAWAHGIYGIEHNTEGMRGCLGGLGVMSGVRGVVWREARGWGGLMPEVAWARVPFGVGQGWHGLGGQALWLTLAI